MGREPSILPTRRLNREERIDWLHRLVKRIPERLLLLYVPIKLCLLKLLLLHRVERVSGRIRRKLLEALHLAGEGRRKHTTSWLL